LFGIVANSATALVFSIAAIAAMTLLWIVWQPITRVRNLAGIVLTFSAIAIGAVTILLLSNPQLSPFEDFLSALGKDSTLTNRTWIWEAGERIARENFWLGTGSEGFWRPESGAAETLNELDHKAPGTKLSFHNSYIEIKVHLGIIGFAYFLIAIGWVLYTTVTHWMRGQGMALSFFLIAAMIVYISTFTESYVTGPFDTMNFLFNISAVSSLASVYHQGRKRRVHLRPNPGT
jgi:exopolysaccharide production protein ExoQ